MNVPQGPSTTSLLALWRAMEGRSLSALLSRKVPAALVPCSVLLAWGSRSLPDGSLWLGPLRIPQADQLNTACPHWYRV